VDHLEASTVTTPPSPASFASSPFWRSTLI
jgi:hypothetical protein